jgi:outer membrane protein assembly factor BamA
MPWDTRVRAYRYIGPRGGYRFGDQTPVWVEQILGFESGIVVPLNRSFAAQNLSINYSFARFKALDGFPQDVLDPMTRLPVFPQTGNVASLRIGWSWSNVQRFLWSIGAEKGSALSVGVDLARPEFGGDFALVVANYSALTYVPLPWFRHHVLGLHASGGTSAGNWGRRGAFAVGGYADIPLPDALRNLIVQPSVALRGYRPAARVGDSFQLFNAEYRFPIWNVDRGVDTIPFFLQRFYGNFFFDYGDATFTGLDLARMKVGVGGEILTDLSVGYFQPITLRLGLARGTSEGGTTQTYVVLSQLF